MTRSGRLLTMLLAVVATALAGCGSGDHLVRTVVKTTPRQTPASTPTVTTVPGSATVPATTSAPTTTGTPTTVTNSGGAAAPNACDPQVSVAAGATCPYAENVFYEYYESNQAGPVEAYSPAAGRRLHADCIAGSSVVTCTASDGGEVRFSVDAVRRYSHAQADHYAATHKIRP